MPIPNTSSSAVFYINSRHHNEESSIDVMNQTATEYIHSKNIEMLSDKQDDPDLYFFKSLLPDFHSLPPAKKRRVKMEMMKLIDEACNEQGQDVPKIIPSSPKSTTYAGTQNENLETTNLCQNINVKNE